MNQNNDVLVGFPTNTGVTLGGILRHNYLIDCF